MNNHLPPTFVFVLLNMLMGNKQYTNDGLQYWDIPDKLQLYFYFHYPTRDLQGSLRLMEQGDTIFT